MYLILPPPPDLSVTLAWFIVFTMDMFGGSYTGGRVKERATSACSLQLRARSVLYYTLSLIGAKLSLGLHANAMNGVSMPTSAYHSLGYKMVDPPQPPLTHPTFSATCPSLLFDLVIICLSYRMIRSEHGCLAV